MARKGRNMNKYIRGDIDEDLSLGTLAAKTLVSDLWDQSATERTLISSIVATWSLDQLTGAQGPLIFGVAHSDYSDAQIEEVIENTGSWDEGSKSAEEISRRLVRQIGTFVSRKTPSEPGDEEFNDGKPMKTKLNWVLSSGDTLRMWAYNVSASALATTVPVMRANGHANLWIL